MIGRQSPGDGDLFCIPGVKSREPLAGCAFFAFPVGDEAERVKTSPQVNVTGVERPIRSNP
jgi:hypothetical protein